MRIMRLLGIGLIVGSMILCLRRLCYWSRWPLVRWCGLGTWLFLALGCVWCGLSLVVCRSMRSRLFLMAWLNQEFCFLIVLRLIRGMLRAWEWFRCLITVSLMRIFCNDVRPNCGVRLFMWAFGIRPGVTANVTVRGRPVFCVLLAWRYFLRGVLADLTRIRVRLRLFGAYGRGCLLRLW